VFENCIVAGNSRNDEVHIYEKQGSEWQIAETLTPPDGVMLNSFGGSVSVHESALAVGTTAHTSVGATYIFRKINDIWSFEELVKGSDTEYGDNFGFAVDVQGDLLVVGAPFAEDESLTNRVRHGIVYAFHYTNGGWEEKGRMIGEYDRDDYRIGESVSIDGDMIVVGGGWYSSLNSDGIFLFQYNGNDWQKIEKIISEDRLMNRYRTSK